MPFLSRPPAMRYNCSGGFTLVELAVVLTLIALLTGGIMAGLNLRHAAQLKSISEEVTSMRDAVGIFRERYHALPGDMYNATQFWGAADTNANNCRSTISPDTRTCNGDGNNRITTAGEGGTYYEAHRFWQHLVNASLLDGSYTGHRTGVAVNPTCLFNNHCGQSRFPNAAYYAATLNKTDDYFVGTGSGLSTYPGDKGHVLVLFRNMMQASGARVGAPLLTTKDAFNIDRKFDDGNPASGGIQSFLPATGATSYLNHQCTTSATPATAQYNLSAQGAQCALLFTNLF